MRGFSSSIYPMRSDLYPDEQAGQALASLEKKADENQVSL
jgi:hypothetical protein